MSSPGITNPKIERHLLTTTDRTESDHAAVVAAIAAGDIVIERNL